MKDLRRHALAFCSCALVATAAAPANARPPGERATAVVGHQTATTATPSRPSPHGHKSPRRLEPQHVAVGSETPSRARTSNAVYRKRTGWQLSEHWFFGRLHSGSAGTGLIWHDDRDQITLNHDGVRWQRRF